MKIRVMGYRQAMQHVPEVPTYVIKIFRNYPINDPSYNPLGDFDLVTENQYFFDEYNPSFTDRSGPTIFNHALAERIISDFQQHQDCSELLVHCYLGINRSPAIAMALDDLFLLDDSFDYYSYFTYNRLVYRTMMEVGKKFI